MIRTTSIALLTAVSLAVIGYAETAQEAWDMIQSFHQKDGG